MNPAFLDNMSWEMAEVYGAITDQILINLAKYFPFYDAGDPIPESAFRYQAGMLAQMGQVNQETMQIIRNGLDEADTALKNSLEQAIIDAVRSSEPDLLKAVEQGILRPAGIPIVAPNQMRAFTLYYQQAADKLNLVNTVMLESTRSAYQQTIADVVSEIELSERINATQQALDIATGEVVMGVSSWNTALRHATDRMKDRGITGFVDHAGRQWSAEAYTAMDIRTTMFNTGRAAVWETNQNFGNDLYLVSYHNGARPLCYPWQNKVISSTNNARTVTDLDGNAIEVIAQSDTSYGEAAGLFGINCKHYPTPFIPGVSVADGKPQDKEENDKAYAESQEQRRLERKLREEKRDLLMAKAQGADDEEIRRLREKCRQSSQDIDDFCQETGRARHRDREAVYTKREFPDKEKYDVEKFERDQKDTIEKYFGSGGAQQGYTVQNATPTTGGSVPPAQTAQNAVTPQTPVVQNVAPQVTQQTQTVVQSAPAKTVKDVSDFSELRTYMKDTHGITVAADVDTLHFGTVREALTGFEAVAAQFPEVAKQIQEITVAKSGVMSCNGTRITFNPGYYTNPAKLQATINDMVAKGWWPKGTTVASIGSHETGHGVEAVLIKLCGRYQYRWEETQAWNDCTEAKLIRSEATKAIKKTPYGKGKKNVELYQAVSRYANDNASETMAECFADVMANGQNANPLSLKIFEIALRMYNSYVNGGTP